MPVCSAPTFHQMREYYIDEGAYTGRVAIGDLNGDNRLDLVVGEAVYGAETTMAIMPGISNFGGFAQETNYTVSGNPIDFTTADVNNDGHLDVIHTQLESIEIFLGNGNGTVQTPPIIYQPQSPANFFSSTATGGFNFFSSTVAKDLNGDGNVDLAISTKNHYPSYLYIRFGNGDGTFNNTQTLSGNNVDFYRVHDVDLNNDGRLDLIVPTGAENWSRIFFGTANGTFAPSVNGPMLQAFELQFLDLNNDGFKDIYAIGRGDSIQYFYNNGQGAFSAPVTIPFNLPSQTTIGNGRAADFTGDGILDIVLSTNVPDIRVYRGISATSFEHTFSVPLVFYSQDLRVSDFNNDGMPDFLVAGGSSSSIFVYINKCGDTTPHYSIAGRLNNYEGFPVEGARVSLTSESVGALSAGTQGSNFYFNDLPAGQNYTITPKHSAFNFVPAFQTVTGLNSDRQIDFEGRIKKLSIYGKLFETGTNGLPAVNVPLRLTGPFNTDIPTTTNALGEYAFRDLYPSNLTYTVQFEPNPIFQSPSPYNIVGLYTDIVRNFSVARRLFSVTVQLTMPNGQPRSGVVLVRNGTSTFVTTDAAGMGTFHNIPAGQNHTFVPGTPSLRFSPAVASVDYLTGDTTINLRVSRRNRSDFDNDGKSDLTVWRPSTGTWYGLWTSDNQFWARAFGIPTDIPAPGDYDGDQKTDIAVFRPSDGTWHIIFSTDGRYTVQQFGSNGDIPVPTDFDRDGKTDVSVYRPSTGVWYTFQSYYQTARVNSWGLPGDRPMTGDFDGDTYNDRIVFRPSTGTWYVNTSADNGFYAVQFGFGSDKTFVGDYDGDTKADIGVWRPETGVWYIWRSSDGGIVALQFGLNGDVPLNGDFDGDGIDDIAVYRPSTGDWYIWRSSDNNYMVNRFGWSEDIPAPATTVR